MADQLPPELSRLGDALTSAAERTIAAGRRRAGRRRLVTTAALGALVFAALTPATLGPAHRQSDLAGFPPSGCDQPHGAQFTMTGCESAIVLDRPYAVR
jgi:hypothetical protein